MGKMRRRLFTIIVFIVLGAGCADVDDIYLESSPDAKDTRALSGGKADDLVGDCERRHILLLVNDPGSNAEHLIAEGLHHRAARNIADYRSGVDGRFGSDEDRYFDSVEAIDDISFVGPVAFEQLAAAIESYCAERRWPTTETVFSPSSYGESHVDRIVDLVDNAEHSIDLAIYGLSDHRAIAALGDAARRGVSVRLLFDEANGDHLRPAGSTSAGLEEMGVDVRYINRTMHHKFAIIDGPRESLLQASTARFFSGSANLAYAAATRYDENTTFHKSDPTLVLIMQAEFNHLWAHSRNLEWNEEIEPVETLSIAAESLPSPVGLEVLLTSANFEPTYSTRWGAGFRAIPFRETVATRIVELIDEAESSVWVAARYLRSRPISEALMNRWRDDPDLDLRVYLDQNEYISFEDHQEQQEELAECLIDASDDEAAIYGCRERGRLFSYALADLGIPLRFKTYAYRWHFSYARHLHHKYLIVDQSTVATGSYNYSNNAEQNSMENVIIYRHTDYPDLVDAFVENFDAIWQSGRHFDDSTDPVDLLIEANDGQEDVIELVFEPMALSWHELTALREAIREYCPDADSEAFKRAPAEHRRCLVDRE